MLKVGFMVSETTMTTQRCLTLWFASVPLMRNRTISHSVHSLYSLHISLISIYFSTAHSLPPSPFSRFPSHCFLLPCLPSSLLAFLLPLHHSSWLKVQLRRYNWRASLLLSSLSPPRMMVFQPPPPTPIGSLCSLDATGCLCALVNRF